MLFNSLSFILLFLPLSLVAYYLATQIGKTASVLSLVIASLVFYCWWNPTFLVLLLASIAVNYSCGSIILREKTSSAVKSSALYFTIAANLLALFYYKYFDTVIHGLESYGIMTPLHGSAILLPLGISFFTFTQIGYLLDCKAGVTKGNNLLDYMLFVTFFPHLIAGPILHYREMERQFADPNTYQLKHENCSVGLSIFIMGLAKKVLIADYFMTLANHLFSHPDNVGMVCAWAGTLSYMLQLYFDFSGYSEMAIGLALIFGIRFPANFNSPYKAHSIIDFWQRWHMTLTRYLTLYLYNPMALWITRKRVMQGKPIAREAVSHIGGFVSMIVVPIFFTMILAGIWHGAGLQFMIFGLLHACYLSINHAWRIFHPTTPTNRPDDSCWYQSLWKAGLTMLAVMIAQIFFRAASTHDALVILGNISGVSGIINHEHMLVFHKMKGLTLWTPITLILGFLWVFTMPNVLQVTAAYKPSLSNIAASTQSRLAWAPNRLWACALGLIAAITILAITGTTEFVYFQF